MENLLSKVMRNLCIMSIQKSFISSKSSPHAVSVYWTVRCQFWPNDKWVQHYGYTFLGLAHNEAIYNMVCAKLFASYGFTFGWKTSPKSNFVVLPCKKWTHSALPKTDPGRARVIWGDFLMMLALNFNDFIYVEHTAEVRLPFFHGTQRTWLRDGFSTAKVLPQNVLKSAGSRDKR